MHIRSITALLLCTLSFTTIALAAAPTADPLLRAPQDLLFFATQAGENTVLLPPVEQAQRDARSNELFFGPWGQARPSVTAKQFNHRIIRKARGFLWDKPWRAENWAKLVHNANAPRYPQPLGAGIITSHADLRALPTALPLFLEATPTSAPPTPVDFFDFFQHSSLAIGTPVYVSHVSTDGEWYYVEYPLLSGWIKAASVALASKSFIKEYRSRPLAVVVRDGLPLISPKTNPSAATDTAPHTATGSTENNTLGKSFIGSAFPMAEAKGDILVPVREKDGKATLVRVSPPEGDVMPKPLPLTPGNIARLGEQMLGQTYAWGGKDEGRDCSLMTRDIFLAFGIWLPRNSRHQAKTGAQTAGAGARAGASKNKSALEKLSPEARKAKIVREAKPFLTLLGFPGHVGLYVGTYEGEPVMLHTILGLRTYDEDVWFRHIIAKTILSTLEPGAHMPELQLSDTLLERLNSFRMLP